MDALARAALTRWPVAVKNLVLVARRENNVWRVEAENGRIFALRMHRKGYRNCAELRSELAWMEILSRGGARVPVPIPSHASGLVVEGDGVFLDLLSWLPGTPLGKSGMALGLADPHAVFFNFGRAMAGLHALSDSWQRPAWFTRPVWDVDGLLGETPVWGRFWENPALDSKARKVITAARQKARIALHARARNLDYGLVHADLVRENVLVNGGQVEFIDFDDGGFGFRLFDVATALLKNRNEPDYGGLEAALLSGYRSLRPLDSSMLSLFTLLRAFTYLGWIMPRIEEPGALSRCQRYVAESVALAEVWLD